MNADVAMTEAAELDLGWLPASDSGLSRDDLLVLKAANHHLLGEPDAGLEAVRDLDERLHAEVDTPEERATLARKIEEPFREEQARPMPFLYVLS